MDEQPNTYHIPVLLSQTVEQLAVKPGGVYLDVTFGGGGHTRALLESDPTIQVVALDWDTNALDLNGPPLQEKFPGRLTLLWGNFAHLYKIAKKEKIGPFDGILADFGTSQFQIHQRAGFSFAQDTPLDMRMSPAQYRVTAAEVVNDWEPEKLRQLFWQLGQEKRAKTIVAAIVKARKERPFKTTRQLAELIENVVPRGREKIHPATRVFQALRIYVNHELDNILAFLPAALRLLKPGGRLVCISFHSLEDRLVKNYFRDVVVHEPGKYEIVTPRAVVAEPEELTQNPSARSARLRALQRLG